MIAPLNKMKEDLVLRNLAARTMEAYLADVAIFLRGHDANMDDIGHTEVRAFLLDLHARGRSSSTLRVYTAALSFFFTITLGRPDVMKGIPRPRKGQSRARRPLARQEVTALLKAAADTPYDYAMISVLVGAGLRISEAVALQPRDIDAALGLLHVRNGKGGKRRSVQLSSRLLRVLRRYWVVERPGRTWLFPARKTVPANTEPAARWADRPVSVDTVRRHLRRIAKRAGLKQRVTPHDLRTTYGTLLLEAGVDSLVVQVLLGHSDLATTAIYAKVRPDLIRRTPSPLDFC